MLLLDFDCVAGSVMTLPWYDTLELDQQLAMGSTRRQQYKCQCEQPRTRGEIISVGPMNISGCHEDLVPHLNARVSRICNPSHVYGELVEKSHDRIVEHKDTVGVTRRKADPNPSAREGRMWRCAMS